MKKANAEWLYRARWGVFTHYLADSAGDGRHAGLVTPEEWNSKIDGFDVAGLARQLAEVHAPYFVITVGQNSGYYLSPNSAYDSFPGFPVSKCSRRDLIADLAHALSPHGIRLMVYVTPVAPTGDAIAKARLEGANPLAPGFFIGIMMRIAGFFAPALDSTPQSVHTSKSKARKRTGGER